MSGRSMERQLEWEPEVPIVLEHVQWPVPPFIDGTKKLTVQRDEELQLTLQVEGVFADKTDLRKRHEEMRETLAGSFIDHDEIEFDAYGGRYALTAFIPGTPSSTVHTDGKVWFQQEGRLDRLVRTWSQKFTVDDGDMPVFAALGPPAWRCDWFINGPHASLSTRFTKRRSHASFLRDREFGAITIDELPRGDQWRDHFVVEAGDLRFAVCEVPEKFAPKWLHPLALQFAAPIPNEDTREAVGEIVSFVVGRRLLRLGATTFDATGWPIEEEMINPFSEGLRSQCAHSDVSPIPIQMLSLDIETTLATLVPSYLRVRDSYGLRNALWGYWAACESPTPIDLALFRAAVEALKKGWFEATATKSKGLYMPNNEYAALTKDLIAVVKAKLEGQEGGNAIINKIARANQMGSNEQVATFFSGIGLPIGAAEQAAMKAANVPAHGGITAGPNLRKLVGHGRAYRALFERTFLRLLGYEGDYIDRSTLGHPSRPLNEPPAGTEPA